MTPSSPPAPSPSAGGNSREVALLALPIMGSQLAHTLTAVVDSAFVGRLGADALGAVGLASTWLWTGFAFFVGAGSGVQTFVAQADGSGERHSCGRWLWHALYLLVPTGALTVVCIAPLLPRLLAFVGLAPELQAAASDYMLARLPGELLAVVWMVVSSFFRGIGDAKTPLYIGIGLNLVNVVLDWALIFGHLGLPALGVRGAGVATSITYGLGAVVSLWLYLGLRKLRPYGVAPQRPSASALRRFLHTAGPIGAHWLVGSLSFAGWTSIVATLGVAPMAASQATLMLMNLSFMPVYGLSIAVTTLAGRYHGAGQPDSVVRTLKSALGLGSVVCAVVAATLLAIPHTLFGVFSTESEVLALARPMLGLSALFLAFDATAIVVSGALRGAGDTRFPFVLETALAWTLFVPGGWLLGVALGGGVMGAWLAALCHVVALAAGLTWRFQGGAWKTVKI